MDTHRPAVTSSSTQTRSGREAHGRTNRHVRPPAMGAVGDLAMVLGPSLLAIGLSFYDIGTRSIWIDESATIAIASQHGAALGAAMAHDGGNMLVYYALVHVLIGAFGNGALVIRAPSAIASGLTVAFVTLIARRLFDRRVALASGMLSALSLPLVYWGQNARAYALMTALVAGCFFAFTVLVDEGASSQAHKWAFVAYVLAMTLAIYMSFVAVLVVPAQLIAVLLRRRRSRQVISALVVSALCCAPLVVLAHQRGSGQLFWVQRPNLAALNDTVQELSSSGLQPLFALTATSYVLMGISLAALVGCALLLGRALAHHDKTNAFSKLLVLSWLVVPLVLALVWSLVGQSIFVPRNLLISLPAFSILIASFAFGGWSSRARRTWAPWSSRLGWACVVLIVVLRVCQLAPSYGVSPENWKAAASYVTTRADKHDCIAFYPADGRMAFEYYIGSSGAAMDSAPRSILPVGKWGKVTPWVEDYTSLSPSALAKATDGCSRLWLVSSHQGQANGPSGSIEHLKRYFELRHEIQADFRDRTTISFGYADPVKVELFRR